MTALDLLLFAQNFAGGAQGNNPFGPNPPAGFPTTPNNQAAAGGCLAMGIGLAICVFVFVVLINGFFIACGWKLFTKAGQPGWAILVPIYNLIIFWKIFEDAGEPGWAILIPIYSTIVLAKVYGKDVGFAVGLMLLPIVFLPMLAFGSAEYIGSMGRGSSRRRRIADEEDEEDDRPRPRRRRRADDEDDEDDRPRRRPRRDDD